MSDTDFCIGAFVGAVLTGAVAMEYTDRTRNRVEVVIEDADVFEPIE